MFCFDSYVVSKSLRSVQEALPAPSKKRASCSRLKSLSEMEMMPGGLPFQKILLQHFSMKKCRKHLQKSGLSQKIPSHNLSRILVSSTYQRTLQSRFHRTKTHRQTRCSHVETVERMLPHFKQGDDGMDQWLPSEKHVQHCLGPERIHWILGRHFLQFFWRSNILKCLGIDTSRYII